MPHSQQKQNCIAAYNVHQSFGSVQVLNGINLTVEQGTVHGILGPNGAGKSTFVDLCVGSGNPTSGTVHVLGVNPSQNSATVRSQLGVVMQEAAFPTGLKVKDAITCWKRYLPRLAAQQKAEFFDISKLSERRINELSGGERRKLDLYLAMMGNPALLVLDEPTTGLDPLARREVWDLIKSLAQDGTTILLTSHYLDEVSALCQRLSILLGGRIVAEGTPQNIAKEHGSTRQGWIEFSNPAIAHKVAREATNTTGLKNVRTQGAIIMFELSSSWGMGELLANPNHRDDVVDFALTDYSLEEAYNTIVHRTDTSVHSTDTASHTITKEEN